MADEKDQNQDDSEKEQKNDVDTGNDDDQDDFPTDKDKSDDEANNDSENSDDLEDSEDDDSKDDSKDDSDDDSDTDDNEEEESKPKKEQVVPRRRSIADYVAERRGKKIAKQADDSEEYEEEEDEDLTPTDKSAIQKEVAKQVAPLVENLMSQSDEAELQAVLKSEPKLKKYAPEVRRWAKVHTTMPIKSLFHAVAGDALKQSGIDTKNEAKDKAKKDSISGTSGTPKSPKKLPDVNTMSDKEFEELDQSIANKQ